jgi:nucleotide-binding universal stress UspA family protein
VPQPYRNSSPERKPPDFHRLLIATDFDAASDAAVEFGAALAKRVGPAASIHVLSVLEALMYTPPKMAMLSERDPDLHPEATGRMASTVRRLHEHGIDAVESSFEFGIASDVIVTYANSGRFDVLIVGRRTKGSTVGSLLPRVNIPLLTVPG